MTQLATRNQLKRAQSQTFETELRDVLGRLSKGLRAVLAALPVPGGIQRAADLERVLGLRTTLAWQVFRAASAGESLMDASLVPGRGAMRKFFDAAGRRKVSPKLVGAASNALDDFLALVRTHAGDRTAFGSMVSDLAPAATNQVGLAHRRAAFTAQRHIWGAEARTQLSCFAIHPGDDDQRADAIFIHGIVDVRRLRRGRAFVVSRSQVGADQAGRMRSASQPLDPAAAQSYGISLLPEFCSQPIPTLEGSIDSVGAKVTRLINGDIGNAGAATVFLADVYQKAIPRSQDERDKDLTLRLSIGHPYRVSILDLLIRKGTFGDEPLRLNSGMYAALRGVEAPLEKDDAIPTRDAALHLGQGLNALTCPDVPRYRELAQHAVDRLGWDGRMFDVYRFRVEYPVMPSIMVVHFDLPTKPTDFTPAAK